MVDGYEARKRQQGLWAGVTYEIKDKKVNGIE